MCRQPNRHEPHTTTFRRVSDAWFWVLGWHHREPSIQNLRPSYRVFAAGQPHHPDRASHQHHNRCRHRAAHRRHPVRRQPQTRERTADHHRKQSHSQAPRRPAAASRTTQRGAPARTPSPATAGRSSRSRTPASAQTRHQRSNCARSGPRAPGSAGRTGLPVRYSRQQSPASAARPQAAKPAYPGPANLGQKRLHLWVAATASVTEHSHRALVYWIPAHHPALWEVRDLSRAILSQDRQDVDRSLHSG